MADQITTPRRGDKPYEDKGIKEPSEQNNEFALLEKYAKASGQKVLSSQSDLDVKVKAAVEMLSWCKERSDIVVLNNGVILSSDPGSREIQNCKIVMMHQGLRPGKVVPATSSLIKIFIENAEEAVKIGGVEAGVEAVSVQQQRLRMIVKEALRAKVSDIHLEIRQHLARIRFRKHGELYVHAEWLPKLGREIASVAFNKETDHSILHFNPLVPQSASMPLVIDGREIRLRLSSLPAHGGFDVVMRVLDTAEEAKVLTLAELGYTDVQREILEKASGLPQGAIIISGPTGAGKTTTLAGCVSMVESWRKVYTIEDPVEKVLINATQVPVTSEQEDRTFASMGVASLRMDPDVIVLGEMRDLPTAVVMVRAALTGHLVYSTLHTNTSVGIITRLVDMGISQNLLADPDMLVCLIAQRLVPVLCGACAKPILESEQHKFSIARWREVLGENFAEIKVRGHDCDVCKGLGIIGRSVVAEIVWIDEAGRHFIKQCDILGWEKYLREHGWMSYRDRTLDLVREGRCDPFDAERIIGTITPAFTAKEFNY